MKCSQFLSNINERRLVCSIAKGSHVKMQHDTKKGTIIFPNHGSQEMGKGLEKKILKDAGFKKMEYGKEEKNNDDS